MIVISNIAGTMSESFAIGKRGVKLLQGTDAPTSELVAPVGSLYLRKSGTGNTIYQYSAANEWTPILFAENPVTTGTQGLVPPRGSTEDRPVSPIEGIVRFNTDLSKLEVYENGNWTQLGNASSFKQSFTNADLVDGKLTITHDLGDYGIMVQVWNNNKQVVNPDMITSTGLNTVEIDLTTFGSIAGTWIVRCLK